ncbi:hypothetical protein NQZ68_003412 [Dissostichus eleginoides]|nr:hypothetical protein NQZ68_003412 [Dissostichus eleginoides]
MQGGPEHSQHPASHSAGGLPGLSVSLIPTSFLLPPVPTGNTNPEPSRAPPSPQSVSCPLHFLLLSLSLQSPAQPSIASDLYQRSFSDRRVAVTSRHVLATPAGLYSPHLVH